MSQVLVPERTQSFEIRPFPAPVGAEVIGLDIARPIPDPAPVMMQILS